LSVPTQNNRKAVSIGDHLFIVEGARKWALYDLLEESLVSIDSASGELLFALAQEDENVEEKLVFLENYASSVFRLIRDNGIDGRLFHQDTSVMKTGTVPMLEFLWLEVTNQCNQKCIHCYGGFCPLLKVFMDVRIAQRTLKEARQFGCERVQFVGGEPFMHRQLWRMVECAVTLGFSDIEIFTNLTLLKDKDIDRIKHYGIHVATTLLGHCPEVHDACTQIAGSFKRWYHNIKKIQGLGIDFRIGVIRMNQNENDMGEIEAFLRREGLLLEGGDFEPDDVRPVGRGCSNAIEPRIPMQYGFCFTVTPQFFHQARMVNPCWRGEMAVTAEGDVFPCVFAREQTVGNLKQGSVKSVVQVLERQYWNITLDYVERCRDCEFRYACMDCRALSINFGLGLYGQQPRCKYDPCSNE